MKAFQNANVLRHRPHVFPRIRAGASLKGDRGYLASGVGEPFSPAFVRGPH